MAITLTKNINIITKFENLIIGLHALYIFNMHVKFGANKMLFSIQSMNLYFINNF